jgi:hypothetical protein
MALRTTIVAAALLLAAPAAAKAPPALSGYGATRADFLAHHGHDKGVTASFTQGAALHVELRLPHPVAEAAALRAAARLLPADSKRIRTVDLRGCEQLVYGSLAFARRYQSAIRVELKGKQPTFSPAAVVSATFDTAPADTIVPC